MHGAIGAAYKCSSVRWIFYYRPNKECRQEEAVEEVVEEEEEEEEEDSAVTLTALAVSRVIPTDHIIVTMIVTVTSLIVAVGVWVSGSCLHYSFCFFVAQYWAL